MTEKEWEKIAIEFENLFCDPFESIYSRNLQWKWEEDKPTPYPNEILDFFEVRLT